MEQQDEMLDVSHAAVGLGLSSDNVRKRIQRGTLRGQWRVILPVVDAGVGSDTTASVSKTVTDSVRDALIAICSTRTPGCSGSLSCRRARSTN
jgi:hypothetical protein